MQKASDTKKAEADAAYEIQKQEQEKTIQTATVNAQIARTEREAELRRQEVTVQQQALEAEINKKADADRYAIEQAAAAELTRPPREKPRQNSTSRKKRPRPEKRWQKPRNMPCSRKRRESGPRAKRKPPPSRQRPWRRRKGMEKKAEAYQKYNQAAIAEMMIQVLPEIAGKIAEPLSQIDKITIIGGDGGSEKGVGSVAGNVPVVMARLFESMKEATGLDLADIMKAESLEGQYHPATST